MTINILLIALCIINPLLVLYAYRKAIQDMQKIENKEEIKTDVELPKIPKKYKPSKEEVERQEKMNAINNYVGW